MNTSTTIIQSGHSLVRNALDHRAFVVAGSLGFAGLNAASLAAAATSTKKPDRSTILS